MSSTPVIKRLEILPPVMKSLAKYALVAFFAANIKTIPLSWAGQFYYRVVVNLFLARSKYLANGEKNSFGVGKESHDLFQYTTFHTYVSPLEIDLYLHKSNSTYFQDLDIARTNLVTKIFQVYFLKCFDNEFGDFAKKHRFSNFPYVPVGTVLCIFKRELLVFQRYQIKSRVFAWDNKWLYVLSKFVVPSGKDEKIYALAITKYVFKKNLRITIPPVEMIKHSDLYNEEVERINQENYKLISHMKDTGDLEKLAAKINFE